MIKKSLNVVRIDAPNEAKDNTKITMSFVASTSAEDRYGDVIAQNGWDLTAYNANPIILFNHDASAMPIGKGEVDVIDGKLLIDVEFDMEDPHAAEIGRKCQAGFLNSVSVGFNAIEAVERSNLPDGHQYKSDNGLFFNKAELLEVSVVTIPANPEANSIAAKKFDLNSRQVAKHILEILEEDGRYLIAFKKADPEEHEEEHEMESSPAGLQSKNTNFPDKGKDKKVSLRNSDYPAFPLEYAQNIKDEYPEIWDEGGNILGNKQYALLNKIQKNNGVPETPDQEEAIRKREAWAARHLQDFRLAGTVAQMKWLVIGEKGLSHMKEVIREEINKNKEKSFDRDVEFADLPVTDEPFNPQDQDRAEIENNILGDGDWERYKKAHLYFDSDRAETKEGYKFIIGRMRDPDNAENAIPEDGRLYVFRDQLGNAVAAINGSREEPSISDEDRKAAYDVAAKYYDKLGLEIPPFKEDLSYNSEEEDEEEKEAKAFASILSLF